MNAAFLIGAKEGRTNQLERASSCGDCMHKATCTNQKRCPVAIAYERKVKELEVIEKAIGGK